LDIYLLLVRLDLGFYVAGAMLAFAAVLFNRQKWMRWVPHLALLGLVLHLAAMHRLWTDGGQFALEDRPAQLSFLAWAAVLVYLLATYFYRLEILGVLILPLAVILLLISNLLPLDVILVPAPMQPGLLFFHITVAILGVAALFLAFGASVVYLIQERGLKAKRAPLMFGRLPSLQRCDSAGNLAMLWGFPLLTLAIITGTIWSANERAAYWAHLPRETFSLLAWVLLGIILYARLVTGWRGRKAAYLTIVAFAAILIRMLGFPSAL